MSRPGTTWYQFASAPTPFDKLQDQRWGDKVLNAVMQTPVYTRLEDTSEENENLASQSRAGNGKVLRPHVYYDEGPFDAPSSDSEEETLLEKGPESRRSGSRSPRTAENGFESGSLFTGELKVRVSYEFS